METSENAAPYQRLIQDANALANRTEKPTNKTTQQFDKLLGDYSEAVDTFAKQNNSNKSEESAHPKTNSPQPIYTLAQSMSASLANLGSNVNLRRFTTIQKKHMILRERASRLPDVQCLDEANCSIAKSLALYAQASKGLFKKIVAERDGMQKRPDHNPETFERFTRDLIETLPHVVSEGDTENIPYFRQARRDMKKRTGHNVENVHRASVGMADAFLRSKTMTPEDIDDFLQEIKDMSKTDEKSTKSFAALTLHTASMLSKSPERSDITLERYFPLKQARSEITDEKQCKELDESLKIADKRSPKGLDFFLSEPPKERDDILQKEKKVFHAGSTTPFEKRPEVETIDDALAYTRELVAFASPMQQKEDAPDIQVITKVVSPKKHSPESRSAQPHPDVAEKHALEIDSGDELYGFPQMKKYSQEHGNSMLRIEEDPKHSAFIVQVKNATTENPSLTIHKKENARLYESVYDRFLSNALERAKNTGYTNYRLAASTIEEKRAGEKIEKTGGESDETSVDIQLPPKKSVAFRNQTR